MRTVFALVAAGLVATACSSARSPVAGAGSLASTGSPPTAPVRTSLTPATSVVTAPSSTSTVPSPSSTHAAAPATRQIVVRPVHADGTPVAGYTVVDGADTIDCSGDASPVAMDPDIDWCTPSADYAIACWRAAQAGHVLCLYDPSVKKLVRLAYSGAYPSHSAPSRPSPLKIVLSDGIACSIRDGGAWDHLVGYPTWYGDYWCNQHLVIYGPANTDGIDRTSTQWSAHEASQGASGTHLTHVRAVVTAYFVGTAA